MPFGDISHHKNLGDPDYDFYDRTYYALGYAFEHRINDVWQFRQNLRYTKSDLSFQTVTVRSYNPFAAWLVVDDQATPAAAPPTSTRTSASSPSTTTCRATSTPVPSAIPCCSAWTTSA
jgi:outer membrane receptor for monomeric catechols